MSKNILNQFLPPDDWESPKWDEKDRVHNWRNYASDAVRDNWNSFTVKQKVIISRMLQDIANNEEWE